MTQLGQTKRPHYMLVPATPTILSFPAKEMPQLPTQIAWALPPSNPINGGDTPFKSPDLRTAENHQRFKPFSGAYD